MADGRRVPGRTRPFHPCQFSRAAATERSRCVLDQLQGQRGIGVRRRFPRTLACMGRRAREVAGMDSSDLDDVLRRGVELRGRAARVRVHLYVGTRWPSYGVAEEIRGHQLVFHGLQHSELYRIDAYLSV